MKILVTGVKGQLGYDIVEACKGTSIEAVGVDVAAMDITVQVQVKQVISSGGYDAVIHCAAWTAVDLAETEREKCYSVNVDGTRYIAEVCKELDIPMMFFSTDYVFDGLGDDYFVENRPIAPINYYGETKQLAEGIVQKLDKHFILRISWVFGVNGNNFIKTMLKLAETRDELSVVNDQIGSPTYTADVAKLVIDMLQTEKYGVYHVTNEGECSWYDFACEIFKQAEIDIKVKPVDSCAFPTVAKRPKNSRMSKVKLEENGFNRLPKWEDALTAYIKYEN